MDSRGHFLFPEARSAARLRRLSTGIAPRGMTLLELLLALALTGLVMVVISMAIDLHLRALDVRRTNVEENQVARAVLRNIATDLRNVVIYEPIDMSGVQDMSSGSLGDSFSADDFSDPMGDTGSGDVGGATGGDSSGDMGGGSSGSDGRSGDTGGDVSGGTGDDLSGMDLGMESDLLLEDGSTVTLNNADIAGTVIPTNVPGLYGNEFELQVDVSRLPRADQYEMMFAASSLGATVDVPSDVKTVSYFLQTEENTTPDMSADWSVAAGSGLVRREMDRAVTSWQSESGDLDTNATGGTLIAPEVNYLQFRYFDGLSWLTEWDSDELGSLPVAVEITLGIDPAHGQDVSELDVTEVTELQMLDMNEFTYRLVVHLPVAQPTGEDESLLTEDLGDLGL